MELKKNPKLDLDRKRPLFLSMGFIVALGAITIAFEWRSEFERIELSNTDHFEPLPEIYITKMEPPKPKVKKTPELPKEVIREIITPDASEEIKQVLSDPIELTDPIPDFVPFVPEDEKLDEIHDFVESMPAFPGGMEAFYKLISKELEYPREARRLRVEGKVFVEFVINENGSIASVRTIKGIGSGCDVEAERVLQLMPKFIPGKQRGRPVKVRMVLPVVFRLN